MAEAGDKKAPAPTKKAAASDDARTHLILDSVWLVDDEEGEPGAEAPVSNPAVQQGAVRKGAASDEERTHLILDAVSLEDEAAPAPAATKSVAPDSQPTRLFIDPERVKSELARSAAAPASSRPVDPEAARSKAAAPVDERTRLMLGPITLKDELMVALAKTEKPSWIGHHLRRVGSWVDDRMHDRWAAALALGAVLSGILPPLLEEQGATASVLSSFGLLVGLAAFGVTWLAKLKNPEGLGDLKAVGARLRSVYRLLALDVRERERSPRYLNVILSGQALLVVGLVGLTGASVCSLISFASGVDAAPSVVRFPSGILLLFGVALVHFAARFAAVAPASEELSESVAAAKRQSALADLSDSLPPSFIAGHTALHRILIALAQWREAPWLDHAGYRAALERHLQRHLPACRVEREKWIGQTRGHGIADLVIDDMVLIAVSHGFGPASAARAVAMLNDLARTWAGKPMILAVFDAPHEAVFQSAVTLSLVELHDQFPLLTVRMPTQRG